MLNISNVSKIQGGESLFSGASFQINPGEKTGLVGPNGAGKTTLFRMIIGEDKTFDGQISFPDNMTIAYFSQNVGEMHGKTALQEVIEGDDKVRILQKQLTTFETQLMDCEKLSEDEMNKILIKMGDVQTEFEKRGGYDLEPRAEVILTGLGVSPADHQKPVEQFSGGWKMRIALAKVLVRNPDLIVMDVMMPRMNGMEALKEMRAREELAFTPVVMLTAEKDIETIQTILSVGVADYILKEDGAEVERRLTNYLKLIS